MDIHRPCMLPVLAPACQCNSCPAAHPMPVFALSPCPASTTPSCTHACASPQLLPVPCARGQQVQQASKQQRKVEAGTGKGVLPICPLAIPLVLEGDEEGRVGVREVQQVLEPKEAWGGRGKDG